MNWMVLAQTFVLVFLAEFGDKTQIAAITLGAKHRSIIEVWVGASAALILVTFIGIVLGRFISPLISPELIKYISGTVFIIIGIVFILGK